MSHFGAVRFNPPFRTPPASVASLSPSRGDTKIPAREGAPGVTVIEPGRAICYDGADSACEEEAR